MNDLEKYFRKNDKRLIHKWGHYFDIYDRHFSRFRNKEIVILEVGISMGGSLQMWRDYFGTKATIYGIDIHPKCKELEEENVKIFIGSQSDRKFLQEVKRQIPQVDILIDDGGHTMTQQIVTFEELFDHVKHRGVYLCEDIHSSYWIRYGGGYRRRGTFIEYSKKFIDWMNAWHSEQRSLKVNEFTKSVDSLHYYDSILVIEKTRREKPHHEKTGAMTFDRFTLNDSPSRKLMKKIVFGSLEGINEVLRFFRLQGFYWK